MDNFRIGVNETTNREVTVTAGKSARPNLTDAAEQTGRRPWRLRFPLGRRQISLPAISSTPCRKTTCQHGASAVLAGDAPDLQILHYAHNGTEIEVVPSVKGARPSMTRISLIYYQPVDGGAERRPSVARTLICARMIFFYQPRDQCDAYRLRGRSSGWRAPASPPIWCRAMSRSPGFGLIEDWEIVRKTRGRMIQVRVTLSEWLYAAITAKSVLTLSRIISACAAP